MKFRKGRWRLALGRLVNLRYINRWVIFCADLFVSLGVSLVGVLGLFSLLRIHIEESNVLKVGMASFVASVASFLAFKVYHGVIRHSTLRGLWRIGGVAISKSILMFLILVALKANFSPSVYWVGGITDCTLTIVMLITLRVFVINVYNSVLSQFGKKRKRILVFGTEEESAMIATSANRHVFMQNYSIVGFVAFGSFKKSIRIAELPVYQIESLEDLYRLIPRNNLDGILFPNIKVVQQERDRLIRYCEQTSLKTLVVPEMEELRGGNMKRSVREIRIEDLLGREEININLGEIGNLLKGKTVLVTGAAGSIGSEICRQLAHFPIKRLVCFDSAETPMHNLRLELEEKFKDLNFVPVIGDVRNPDRVDYVFRNWLPQVVFHAAAYKHVPLMEENPCEAIRTNVFGTRVMADAAVAYGVEKFVMDGYTITGLDEQGQEVFSHSYKPMDIENENGFIFYESEDENSGEFTYFAFSPDTMESTYHLEFRYAEDVNDLQSWFEGNYAYWNAAGIAEDYDLETMKNVIELFATENLSSAE